MQCHRWLQWTILAMCVITRDVCCLEDNTGKAYVPRAKRPRSTMFKLYEVWMKEKRKSFEQVLGTWLKTRKKRVRARLKPKALGKRRKSIKLTDLLTITMYAMQTTDAKTLPRQAPFDTDSGLLRIDNCATRSISPYTEDCISKLTPLPNRKVQGIGGKVGRLMSGTIKWDIEDDEGVVHSIKIPNSIYLPQAPSRLLSPQH